MALPDHLFASCEGALYDTRDPNWSKAKPVRWNYKISDASANTLTLVKAALRAGPYTDLGGYPLYFTTMDGAALSYDAVREQFAQVCGDHMDGTSTGWRITGVAINYEDATLTCDHTGKPIPSAYGEEEEAA